MKDQSIDININFNKKNILFIIPPNITFNDFFNPGGNVKVVQKGKQNFGSLITEPPLGVISLYAYVKKSINNVKLIDFNVELNKVDSFEHEWLRPESCG